LATGLIQASKLGLDQPIEMEETQSSDVVNPGSPDPILAKEPQEALDDEDEGHREGRFQYWAGVYRGLQPGEALPQHFTSRHSDVYTQNITKESPEVVQIRVDFISLVLGSPVQGECRNDSLMISGADMNSLATLPPLLCGDLTGQHLYLSVKHSDQVQLTIRLGVELGQQWDIKTTQLVEGDPLVAPMYCLQYHKDLVGNIRSFNSLQSPGLLNRHRYSICLKPLPNFCDVSIKGELDIDEEDTLMIGTTKLTGLDNAGSLHLHWNYTGTNVITVETDGDNDEERAGFSFKYKMLPCYESKERYWGWWWDYGWGHGLGL